MIYWNDSSSVSLSSTVYLLIFYFSHWIFFLKLQTHVFIIKEVLRVNIFIEKKKKKILKLQYNRYELIKRFAALVCLFYYLLLKFLKITNTCIYY